MLTLCNRHLHLAFCAGFVYASYFFKILHINASNLGKLLKRQAHKLYICALVLLWMSITSSFTITWLYTRIPFVDDDSSPTSVLDAVTGSPVAIYFIPDFVGSVISQSILVTALHFAFKNQME